MGVYKKLGSHEQDLKWAHIWFQKFSAFHGRSAARSDMFTSADVIAFLQSYRDQGTPAWKRMKILEGIVLYRRDVQKLGIEDLVPLQQKMVEIIQVEKSRGNHTKTIDDVVGKIDPSEMDAIQSFRRAIRTAGLKYRTEKAYVQKLKGFMKERGLKQLADFDSISDKDVEDHLSTLAVDGNVAPSTQNQAFHALLKFFTLVLKRDMGRIEAIRATNGTFVPTVLDEQEVASVLDGLGGVYSTIGLLLYGCGMRIGEALRLRVKDIDFANKQIEIRNSKFDKSRLVPMPDRLVAPLKRWVTLREITHDQDLADGTASVWLPYALDRKYTEAHCEFKWQYLFASDRFSRDPRTGKLHRHHVHADSFAKRLREAVKAARIHKRITSHTFRHCFASHHLWNGTNIREIQELLGHSDVKTTEIYTHVRNPNATQPVSPLDRLTERVRSAPKSREICIPAAQNESRLPYHGAQDSPYR